MKNLGIVLIFIWGMDSFSSELVDNGGLLDPNFKNICSKVLQAHQDATNEELNIRLEPELINKPLINSDYQPKDAGVITPDLTKRVIIQISPKLGKVKFERNFLFETILSDSDVKEIESVFESGLNSKTEQAIGAGILKLLIAIDSPALDSEPAKALRARKNAIPLIKQAGISGFWYWLYGLGTLSIFSIILFGILQTETHITESGAFRVGPMAVFWEWLNRRRVSKADLIDRLHGFYSDWN
jgi:hypothetical protein